MRADEKRLLEQLDRVRPAFEAVQAGLDDGLVLFGAGQYGRTSLEYLRAKGRKVLCFVDSSTQKQGTVVDGVPVVGREDPLLAKAGAVLITARHAVANIAASLKTSAPQMSFDAWFLNSEIERYNLLRDDYFSDERSVQCMNGVMLAMLTGDEANCAAVMDPDQYFCLPQFLNIGTDHFVDAGAYVGDTVEKFIWANNGAFKRIYAFEPGQQQMLALSARKERLVKEWALNAGDVELVGAGLGERDSTANLNVEHGHLQGATLTTNKGGGGVEVKVYTLDSFMKDRPVTFIKADVEGMEMAMLRGATETIRANKPRMALSVYHRPDDLFSIVEYVRGIHNDYKLALRQHSPLLMDTTLYCWA